MMLFPAVLMNFPNSKVCVIGEWSIELQVAVRISVCDMVYMCTKGCPPKTEAQLPLGFYNACGFEFSYSEGKTIIIDLTCATAANCQTLAPRMRLKSAKKRRFLKFPRKIL